MGNWGKHYRELAKRKKRRPATDRATRLNLSMEERLAQEGLILSIAEEFYVMMDALGLTKTSCAKKLRVPESHVKRILDGRNMTLRTLASTLHTLGYRAEVRFVKAD